MTSSIVRLLVPWPQQITHAMFPGLNAPVKHHH